MARPLFDAGTVRVAKLAELVECVEAGTVSKTLLDLPGFKQVLFAMDAGQELSEHRAPYVALVQVLDGRLRMRVCGEQHALGCGDWLLMPADAPHDVHAEERTRFVLTLVKSAGARGGE